MPDLLVIPFSKLFFIVTSAVGRRHHEGTGSLDLRTTTAAIASGFANIVNSFIDVVEHAASICTVARNRTCETPVCMMYALDPRTLAESGLETLYIFTSIGTIPLLLLMLIIILLIIILILLIRFSNPESKAALVGSGKCTMELILTLLRRYSHGWHQLTSCTFRISSSP